MAHRLNEQRHELLGRQVGDPTLRLGFADVPGDGVHQVGLAQTHTAVEEQRVEGDLGALGHAPGGGVGEFVGLADHEVLEAEALDQLLVVIRDCVPVLRHLSAVEDGRCGQGAVASRAGRGFDRVQRCGKVADAGLARWDRRAGLSRRADDDFDSLDLRLVHDPQRAQALEVVGLHPVADEARGHRQADPLIVGFREFDRTQPRAVGALPVFTADSALYLRPDFLTILEGVEAVSHGLIQTTVGAVSARASKFSACSLHVSRWPRIHSRTALLLNSLASLSAGFSAAHLGVRFLRPDPSSISSASVRAPWRPEPPVNDAPCLRLGPRRASIDNA